MTARVAAFDFDGTLTTCDSVLPFLREFVDVRAFRRAMLRAPQASWAAVRADRDRLRILATRAALRGRSREQIAAVARQHAEHIMSNTLRPDMIARLESHRRRGHATVLVSAS